MRLVNDSFPFQRKLLDVSLGFAAGVMVAASYWSLLAPAIEMATESKIYGAEGEYAFVPVAVGFLVGAAFVYGTDVLISTLGIQSPNVLLAMQSVGTKQRRKIIAKLKSDEDLDDDYDLLFNDVQISGGKIYASVESTAIDGISFSSFVKSQFFFSFSLYRLGKWDQFVIMIHIIYIYISQYMYMNVHIHSPLFALSQIYWFLFGNKHSLKLLFL